MLGIFNKNYNEFEAGSTMMLDLDKMIILLNNEQSILFLF